MKKRVLSILLAALLLVCVLPLRADAAATVTVSASTVVKNAFSVLSHRYPYVLGGESPAEGGLDDSGFVYYVLHTLTGVNVSLEACGRSRDALAKAGSKITEASSWLPGDILQFKNGHVALFIGGGLLMEAGGSNPAYVHAREVPSSDVEYAVRLTAVVQDGAAIDYAQAFILGRSAVDAGVYTPTKTVVFRSQPRTAASEVASFTTAELRAVHAVESVVNDAGATWLLADFYLNAGGYRLNLTGYVDADQLCYLSANGNNGPVHGKTVATVSAVAINNKPQPSTDAGVTMLGTIPGGAAIVVDPLKAVGKWQYVTYNNVSGYSPASCIVVENTPHRLTHVAGKAASCTAAGTREYWTCDTCKRVYSNPSGAKEIAASDVTLKQLEHKLTHVARKEATCEASGTAEYWFCSNCCNYYSDSKGTTKVSPEKLVLPATGHEWGPWTVTTAPTADKEGVETRTCLHDKSHTETRKIPSLNHKHTLVETKEKPAKCAEDGVAAYWTCSGCGKRFSDAAGTTEIEAPTVLPAFGHDWGSWVVTLEPGAETKGVEARTCKRCETTETRHIPELNHKHTLVTVAAVSPTCEEEGAVACWKCSECERLFSDAEGTVRIEAPAAVPALGHEWGAWMTTKAPTTSTTGVETRCCKRDSSHTQTRSIPVVTAGDNPFSDVAASEYYYVPVVWAVKKGVTSGTTDTTFSPKDGCTRAQVVTFLWRAMGKPEPNSTECAFMDLAADAYYYKAVLWAVEQGVTTGTSNTTFSPGATCSRSQIVTFLWRAMGKPEPAAQTGPFTDVKSADYFCKAVLWAVENQVTVGTSSTTFSPDDTCTRGQIVTFLYRAMEK